MTADEFNKQHNMFGRLVTFIDQLYIGPLNYEMSALEWMWRSTLQLKKRLEEKQLESYVENRNLRDKLYALMQTKGSEPDHQPATNESGHPNINRQPNTNECGETWEDVLAFFDKNSNGMKRTKQAVGSHESDNAQQSLDPVGQQVVREQVVTEQVSTKSPVFVT